MNDRRRLTPHQRYVLAQLERMSRGGNWISLDNIGSKGALEQLVDKGFAQRDELAGPRGGRHLYYRPLYVRDGNGRLVRCAGPARSQA
jgi:hypothetical protein